jgi:hypothetical protein
LWPDNLELEQEKSVMPFSQDVMSAPKQSNWTALDQSDLLNGNTDNKAKQQRLAIRQQLASLAPFGVS